MSFRLIDPNCVRVTHTAEGVLEGEIIEKPLNYKGNSPAIGSLALSVVGLDRFFDLLKTRYSVPKGIGESSSRKTDGFNSFSSYEEAVTTFQEAPHKIRVFVPKEENVKVPSSVGNDIYYDVVGDYLDVGRYLDGEPEQFGVMSMGNPLNLFATVVINVGSAGFVDEATLRRRGERILRLIDWLESQRIRTSVIALSANTTRYIEVVVKEFHESFNIDSIAVVTNPDFLRRCCFRVCEYSKTYSSMYGYSLKVSNGDIEMPLMPDINLMLFSDNRGTIKEVDKVFDNAEKQIEKSLEDEERYLALNI